MFNQHAKWLKVTRQISWRRPIASLTYLLTSHVWRQDHNGFSHQDPGFIDHVLNKKADIIRVYLPPDANTLLSGDRSLFAQPALRQCNCGRQALDGKFRLKPISKPRGWPDVITAFLCSLAQHWDGKLVIVSGYDGDGAAALSSIKEAGGITIAKKPDTATQPDMPESAIETGYMDFILPPEGIAEELVRIAHVSRHSQPG